MPMLTIAHQLGHKATAGTDVPGGAGPRLLMLMKVGRIFVPFIVLTKAIRELIASLLVVR